MDARCQELLHTLRDARVVAESELAYFTTAPYLDALMVLRLQNSAAELAGQSDYLVRMLRDRGMDGPMMEMAKELGGVFREVEDQSRSLRRAARAWTN